MGELQHLLQPQCLGGSIVAVDLVLRHCGIKIVFFGFVDIACNVLCGNITCGNKL